MPASLARPPIGGRVWVPLGRKTVIGMVMGYAEKSNIPRHRLKPIESIIDNESLFSSDLLALSRFASRYYHYPIGQTVLQNLPAALRQGQTLATLLERCPSTQNTTLSSHTASAPPLLTEPQNTALKILTEYPANVYRSHLLFGVTGSGKTEIYLQLTAQRTNEQVLILVPEIGLTPQLLLRFQERFPNQHVLAFHSGLTPKQRLSVWLQAWSGQAHVIVGTRSSVFLPLPHLSLIVVDEEHDASFKQQDSLRYSARDLALYRAQLKQIPIILGSATPSLETYANAQKNKHTLIPLPERAGGSTQPDFRVVDLKKKPLTGGLAPEVIEAIEEKLAAKEQVLIFLNRRGYAPTTLCHTCGTIADCPACDAHLTWHEKEAWLICHHCDRKIHKGLCQQCQALALTPIGYGTERLEGFLKERFKGEILRFDRDNMNTKKKLLASLSLIHENQVQIIIGTQMLAKGHHFPNVTLVVIVDVDQALYSTDFKSQERLAQLITQVSGRAGRGKKPGTVYLQTHQPDHWVLNVLLKEGYARFAECALNDRRGAHLPPYTYSALIHADSKDEVAPFEYLRQVRQILDRIQPETQQKMMDCLGPIAPRLSKLSHYHRAQLLLNTPNRQYLHQMIDALQTQMVSIRVGKTIRMHVEVDPQEI